MAPLSLLSLPFFLLPTFTYAQDAIHVELSRRAPHERRSVDYLKEAERLRFRYGYSNSTTSSVPARRGKRATAGIPVINQDSDSSYFGALTTGTPAQAFNVILDTGSADLWLASNTCTGCGRSTHLYNPQASSSFKASASTSPIVITYGSGQVSGTLAQDTVSMGGFTIASQTLLSVNKLSSGLVDGSVSGIMGLAWSPLASTRAAPFWQALAQNGQLTTPEMSFWLTREINVDNAPTLAPGGVFTLGGTNSSLYTGDIEFLNIPVQTPSFWLLALSGVSVNGQNVQVATGSSALSAIDTGTTLIGGPSEDVAAIWATVPGSAPSTSNQGFFTFPCTTKVAVNMAFGGKSWPINTVDMNLGPDTRGSSNCLGAIFDLSMGSSIPAGGSSPAWVVGDTFLKNVYSVFRAQPPSVGFAQLSSLAGGSGVPSKPASSGSTVLTKPVPTSTVYSYTTVSVGLPGSPSAGGSSSSGSSSAATSLHVPAFSMGVVLSTFMAIVLFSL